MKKIIMIAAVCLCSGLASPVPALETGLDFDRGAGGIKAALSEIETPPVPVPAAQKGWFSNNGSAQTPKEWTVMVYMNGKNDLEIAGLYNLNKMELVGSDNSINIITETGRMNGQAGDVHMDGDWTGSRRYYIVSDSNENKVRSKVKQSFDSVDMGDWKHLVDFAKWGMKNYPAKHYALIVWNHGSGWVTSKGMFVNKGISYDFETKNHISTPELGAAMREIGKVDILAYDACLMQMAELLYEVKDYADYVVGSEETVPGLGFPYDTMLRPFKSAKSSEELAAQMVRAYELFYYAAKFKVTLSAVRMAALPEFLAAFNAWTDALLASDRKPQIKRGFYYVGAYEEKDNKDLYDFARLAAEADPDGAVAATGRAMKDILTGRLIIGNMAYKGNAGRDEASHGLAIYLPGTGYNEKYGQLAWARDTRWDDFLKEMKGVTAPGFEFMNVCTDPRPTSSMSALMLYMTCLSNFSETMAPTGR